MTFFSSLSVDSALLSSERLAAAAVFVIADAADAWCVFFF